MYGGDVRMCMADDVYDEWAYGCMCMDVYLWVYGYLYIYKMG